MILFFNVIIIHIWLTTRSKHFRLLAQTNNKLSCSLSLLNLVSHNGVDISLHIDYNADSTVLRVYCNKYGDVRSSRTSDRSA